MLPHNTLKGKRVLITGANGRLGQGMTLALLARGAYVYVTDIQEQLDNRLLKELENKENSNYQYLVMDVTSKESIIQAESRIEGSIDVLINNAGIAVFTPFADRREEELDAVYNVNLKGNILCSQVFSRKMIQNKDGKIINIGSIYGVVPPDMKIYGDSGINSSEIYGATKAGVIQLTKYLAAQLAEYNIKVNVVNPGGIFNDQKQNFVNNYIEKTPLRRMANVEDLVGIISFLCSDESNYITGQCITVDGGFTLNN